MLQYEPETIGDVQAAIAAGAALGEPRPVPADGTQGVYAVLPKDYELASLEEYLPRPLRIRQKVTLHDTDSFIAYVNEFGRHGVSHLFFNAEKEEFVAVLDYHEATGIAMPNWCEHVATYTTRRSAEFQTWLGKNRQQLGQVDFARFLEENLPDVVEPAGAELLEVALTLEAKKEVAFSSGVRLSNGQIQFTYDEEIRGTAKKGTLEIPDGFVLGISIHENGPAYRIPVRLRWRLHDGKAVFWYEIQRPHRFIADALKEIRDKVQAETALAVLSGAAS